MPLPERPLAWEDDFSRGSIDYAPFGEPVPLASMSAEKVARLFRGFVPDALRQGLDLETALACDPAPLPNDSEREGYSVGNPEWFWISGLVDWLKMRAALHRHGLEPKSVLEMGAATGRVLRHLAAQAQFPELWAFDINHRHVRWISRYLDQRIRAFHNSALPHLPIADGRLDFVCAFSVFTHIDTFETAWIAELFRILRPGGLGYITFQTEHTWQAIAAAPPDDHRHAILKQASWFRPEMLKQPLPAERLIIRHSEIGPYRGMGFHHSDYLARLWAPWFELLELRPLDHGRDQTVAIFRRRAD
jgi:SAM-dependent methyltransferase